MPDVTPDAADLPSRAGARPGHDRETPDRALLDQLHHLLAGARQQQTVLRESLATVIGFLERPGAD